MKTETYITSSWTNGIKTVQLVRRTKTEESATEIDSVINWHQTEDFYLSGHLTPATGFFPSSLTILFAFLKANGYHQLPGLTIRVHQFR